MSDTISFLCLQLIFAALLVVALAAPGYYYPSLLPYAAAHFAVPAPYAYSNGYSVVHSVEPVEQHGYTIAY